MFASIIQLHSILHGDKVLALIVNNDNDDNNTDNIETKIMISKIGNQVQVITNTYISIQVLGLSLFCLFVKLEDCMVIPLAKSCDNANNIDIQ